MKLSEGISPQGGAFADRPVGRTAPFSAASPLAAGSSTGGASTSLPSPNSVLLVAEGDDPSYWSRLSGWCQELILGLPGTEFSMIAISEGRPMPLRFERLPDLRGVRPVPCRGQRVVGRDRLLRSRRRRTTEAAIVDGFSGSFSTFIAQVLGAGRDDEAFVQALCSMHRFALDHDMETTMRSRAVWSCLTEEAQRHSLLGADSRLPDRRLTLRDLAVARRWLNDWLLPVSSALPATEVVHATNGGACALVGLVAKLEHGAALVLSERSTRLRDASLAEHSTGGRLVPKILGVGLARRMTEVAHAYADVVVASDQPGSPDGTLSDAHDPGTTHRAVYARALGSREGLLTRGARVSSAPGTQPADRSSARSEPTRAEPTGHGRIDRGALALKGALRRPQAGAADSVVVGAPPVPLLEIIRRFWPYARPYRRYHRVDAGVCRGGAGDGGGVAVVVQVDHG